MKAEELMIGDWVDCLESTHKERVYAQVEAIEEYHSVLVKKENANWFLNIADIAPIPLTGEILEKNGFILEHYTGKVMKNYWWTREDFVFPENRWDSVGRNDFKYKYVHQLQHALKLCGINKEIKL